VRSLVVFVFDALVLRLGALLKGKDVGFTGSSFVHHLAISTPFIWCAVESDGFTMRQPTCVLCF